MSYSHTSNWIDSFLHQDEGALFQFAGAHSLTANRLALEAAKQFIAEGRDESAVRQKTGWFMGEDDCWRYEISDRESQLNITAFERQGDTLIFNGKLKDLIDHPKLFAAYPLLANLQVNANIARGMEDNGGFRHAIVGADQIHKPNITAQSNNFNSLQENLLHEIQHAIQNVERFAAGTNSDFLWEAYLTALSDRETDLNDRLKDLRITNDNKGIIGREIDIIEAELSHIAYAFDQAQQGHWNDHFHSLYMNHAGEREARLTAKDWKLTDEERSNRTPALPQVSSFKPIIVFNGTPFQNIAAELNLTPKANITLLPRESLMKLTHAANRDTFNHECGHMFLHFEGITAQGRRPSPFQNKILDYLGVNSFNDIKRVHDEMFARGFEQFLREREAEANAPKGMNKVFGTMKDWVGNLGKTLIEKEEPLSPAARAMFEEMISTRMEPNPINVDQAEKHSRLLAMKLVKTGIYERGEAYSCAQMFASYALAKCERDPDFPTVDRVFDQLNLKIEQAAVEDLQADIKFDFESFDLNTLVRDKIQRFASPPNENPLNQYDLNDIGNDLTQDRTHTVTRTSLAR